jgi:phage shock protein PspC (stress-responsive transcriptional regulator)
MTSDTPTTKRLTRSSSDKMLGGVAGGLAEYFSIDPIVVRVGFAVATVFSLAGAVAYLALLAFVPSDARPLTPAPA